MKTIKNIKHVLAVATARSFLNYKTIYAQNKISNQTNKISALVFKLFVLLIINCMMQTQTSFAQLSYPATTHAKPISIAESGRLKFREDWVYSVVDGQVNPKGLKVAYEHFDSLGMKLEEANYDLKGKSLSEVTYTYDILGAEIQCLGLKANESFYHKWTYNFIDSTQSLEKTVYKNSVNKQKWVYRFDTLGNIVEETNYSADGTPNYRYLITYTTFGKPLEFIEYSGSGIMYEKWLYIYNTTFQNIEVMQFGSKGELFKTYINKFDAKGNRKETMTFNNEGIATEKNILVSQFYK